MIEQITLGIIQGIVEWLPVSSEGMLVLVKTNFFPPHVDFEAVVKMALVMHLGTFLSALIYFRTEVGHLLKALIQYKKTDKETKLLLNFLILTTLISGVLGLALIKIFAHIADQTDTTGKVVTLFVGILLLGTGMLELKAKKSGQRHIKDLKLTDSILLGIVQGLAALPGFSRSGLTVSALLLTKFDKEQALKLSFLMSLPIVLAGNVILHFHEMQFSPELLVGVFCAFVFGLATIHLLLKLAQKINFGIFVLFFGLLTIFSTMI